MYSFLPHKVRAKAYDMNGSATMSSTRTINTRVAAMSDGYDGFDKYPDCHLQLTCGDDPQ